MNGTFGFLLGCNYWASHAGIYMWRNWDASVVEEDLKKLSACGISHLRVFPLWPDFQPLTRYVNSGIGREMRIHDRPLDKTPEGIAGVDPVMISRFDCFVKLCEKYGMKLIVCLINGWMSGRMFYPPAFQNTNVILNKTAVKWQIRFVKYFVNRFKSYENIVAWEPGNETNVLMGVEEMPYQADEYYVWLSNLTNTIRGADSTRPVISGIHGLSMQGLISPADIGEICDVTTVHPYPAFVPHCFTDGLNSMKSRLHATAESVFYSDLGGVPCLCEEIGTLSNMLGWEKTAADYVNACAKSLFVHDSTGIMWWCAFDQHHLTYPPYDWCGVERELGLIKNDGEYKLVANAFKSMENFLGSVSHLPSRNRHAVCILTRDQDQWGVAYSSFVMAKQAGFDLQFADAEYEIPHSNCYMLPSLRGDAVPRRTLYSLLERVREDGAVLYISWDDAILAPIEDLIGGYVCHNDQRMGREVLTFSNSGLQLSLNRKRRLTLNIRSAEVLATEPDGNPALICNHYGKGKIFFMTFAPEQTLCEEGGEFSSDAYYKIYETVFKDALNTVVRRKSDPNLGITEHPLDDEHMILAMINYADHKDTYTVQLRSHYRLKNVLYGDACEIDSKISVNLENGDICLLMIQKTTEGSV